MINAEEHKKLLEQITELERNSTNFFDVEKEFFLIDSENLSNVQTRFYGYSIQATGIYEEDNLTEEAVAGLDGRGCYVYVEVRNGKITIKQDLNGCWGIYLFHHGDYFALSNSFFRLLDQVKFKYPLTINRDYCHYLMVDHVAVQSQIETAVKEIEIIERNAVMHIDIAKKKLQIEMIDYKMHSVPLDSEKGITILDRWVEFWGSLFRNIAKRTKFIRADLTGGFDSRIHFVPLLHSGIDLNQIRIYSIKDDSNPTFLEDYAIASQIAETYNFKLNQPFSGNQFLNYSLNDAFNSDSYSQQTFRNLPTVHYGRKGVNKIYLLSGLSGEMLRKTWHMSPQKFINSQCWATKRYSHTLAQSLTHSIQNIIKSIFNRVRDKYRIEDQNSIDIPQYLYHETRTRNHCGKEISNSYLRSNTVTIVPSYDPEIQTLKLKTSECPDYNLLMILLFTRYAPDLLKIRFDKFHEAIDLKNLIPYAKKLNERFPRHVTADKVNQGKFHFQPRNTYVEQIISSGHNNPSISANLANACLKAMFESSRTYGLFTAYFDDEFYHYAASYYENHVFGRNRPMYAILGITRVIEDVEISQRNHLLYRDVQRYLEQDFVMIDKNNDEKIIYKFKPYFNARIDIKFMAEGDFQIFNVSDEKAPITKPAWFQSNGVGYVIQSYVGKLEFVAKATTDGEIRFCLRGMDVRDPEDRSKRIPYWIDYTKFIVNGETIFDKLTPAWHDKPYVHNMEVKADEEIKIQVEWLPHRSDT